MKKVFLVLLFFLIGFKPFCQTNDFGIWSSVSLEKEVSKWTFAGDVELRTKDHVNQVDRWTFGLSAKYALIKYLDFGAGYEFIYYYDTKYSDFQPRHRGIAFATGKMKFGRFSASLRERVQVTKKDDSDRIKKSGKINEYEINPEWAWRNRLKLSYNVPKIPLTPSVSAESFYLFDAGDLNGFYDMRYRAGLDYKFNKRHSIEVYGQIDSTINTDETFNKYVLGFSYLISL